jgi:TetR/AcrR family transcriptional repressor of nem operon
MDTRNDLIEATRRLLWERGYEATSPRAILDASGAGQGSMYHHFRGKEALAAAAIERNGVEMREQIETDLASGRSALERITAYLTREREVLNGCRFGRLVQDADVIDSPILLAEVSEMFTWIRAQLAAVIDDGKSTGEFPQSLDAAAAAAAIAATLQGAYVLARADQNPHAFDQSVEGVLAMLAATTRAE